MGILRVICLSLVFCSSAFATDISTILQKPGRIVYLKSEFVSSHFKDGTPTYYEFLTYGNGRHNLSCLAGYSTSILNSQLQLIPTDVNIQPGTSYSWNSTPGPFSPTYSYEILSGERYVETFHLYFFNTNTLAELSCSVSHKDPTKRATLKDFEESTGGRMTLRPDIF